MTISLAPALYKALEQNVYPIYLHLEHHYLFIFINLSALENILNN